MLFYSLIELNRMHVLKQSVNLQTFCFKCTAHTRSRTDDVHTGINGDSCSLEADLRSASSSSLVFLLELCLAVFGALPPPVELERECTCKHPLINVFSGAQN